MAATLPHAVNTSSPAPGGSRLLLACDAPADAEAVRRLLTVQAAALTVCSETSKLQAAFDRTLPHVLLLAFPTLEAAQQCCVQLYRHSGLVHTHPHRTLLLCARDEVERAFELCRTGHFDDYVPFAPLPDDAPRLAMSVHLALQALAAAQGPAQAQFLAQARRIAELQTLLEAQITLGRAHTEQARQTASVAQSKISDALHDFSRRVLESGLDQALSVRHPLQVEQAFGRLHAESIQPPLQQAAQALQPMSRWVDQLGAELAAPLQSAAAGAQQASRARPLVLVVDDDGFLCKVLSRILSVRYEVQLAASGAMAMAMVRLRSPDLILMDVELPDANGVDLTRRLKKTAPYSGIPIIMLTGHSDRQVLVDSRGAGAADFIVKPFERELVLKKVAEQLSPGGASASASGA